MLQVIRTTLLIGDVHLFVKQVSFYKSTIKIIGSNIYLLFLISLVEFSENIKYS